MSSEEVGLEEGPDAVGQGGASAKEGATPQLKRDFSPGFADLHLRRAAEPCPTIASAIRFKDDVHRQAEESLPSIRQACVVRAFLSCHLYDDNCYTLR